MTTGAYGGDGDLVAVPIFWRLRRRRDRRGRRVVAVIECVLNQNARDAGAARAPAANDRVVEVLRRHRVGIVQMPCPEMACLGLARTRPPGMSLRTAMETPTSRARCAALAKDAAARLRDYADNGITVVAVLGGDLGSPGCAVLDDRSASGDAAGSGVFIEALSAALAERGLSVPFRGLRDSSARTLSEDLAWLEALLRRTPPTTLRAF